MKMTIEALIQAMISSRNSVTHRLDILTQHYNQIEASWTHPVVILADHNPTESKAITFGDTNSPDYEADILSSIQRTIRKHQGYCQTQIDIINKHLSELDILSEDNTDRVVELMGVYSNFIQH